MKLSMITAAAFTLAPVFAAPTKTPTHALHLMPRNATVEPSTTSTIPTSTSTAERFSVTQTLYPALQVRWSSKTPKALGRHSSTGHILDSPNEQVTTAVLFHVPKEAAGKTCRLVFRMSSSDWIVGNPAVDIFKLKGCLNDDETYQYHNARDVAVGHITAVKGSKSEWPIVDMRAESKFDPVLGSAPQFSCVAGKDYSFELAARAGGNIGWSTHSSGLSIEICG